MSLALETATTLTLERSSPRIRVTEAQRGETFPGGSSERKGCERKAVDCPLASGKSQIPSSQVGVKARLRARRARSEEARSRWAVSPRNRWHRRSEKAGTSLLRFRGREVS